MGLYKLVKQKEAIAALFLVFLGFGTSGLTIGKGKVRHGKLKRFQT